VEDRKILKKKKKRNARRRGVQAMYSRVQWLLLMVLAPKKRELGQDHRGRIAGNSCQGDNRRLGPLKAFDEKGDYPKILGKRRADQGWEGKRFEL